MGQSRTTTRPPVARAAAKNGAALERSGSTTRSRPISAPGVTRQTSFSPPSSGASTWPPALRIMSTVIRMCGSEGTVAPTLRISTPLLKRAPESSSAEMNWEDEEASTSTWPPSSAPAPCTISGNPPRPPSSIRAPRVRSASITPCCGRSWLRGSPSKCTGPSARVASGGRKRITVPALPTSTWAGPRSCSAGMIRQASPPPVPPDAALTVSSTVTPRARRPSAISCESRLRSGRRTQPGPSARAASTSARLVADFEPGMVTVASTAAVATGAGHRGSVMPPSL